MSHVICRFFINYNGHFFIKVLKSDYKRCAVAYVQKYKKI